MNAQDIRDWALDAARKLTAMPIIMLTHPAESGGFSWAAFPEGQPENVRILPGFSEEVEGLAGPEHFVDYALGVAEELRLPGVYILAAPHEGRTYLALVRDAKIGGAAVAA